MDLAMVIIITGIMIPGIIIRVVIPIGVDILTVTMMVIMVVIMAANQDSHIEISDHKMDLPFGPILPEHQLQV
jgi:hypothetical protein